MPTQTQARPQNLPVIPPAGLEEVEYPPEVIDRLEKEIEIAELQIATGELQPMTIAEIAAAVGLRRP